MKNEVRKEVRARSPGRSLSRPGVSAKDPGNRDPKFAAGDPEFSLKKQAVLPFLKKNSGSALENLGSNRSRAARMFKEWFEVAYLRSSSSHECGEYSCIEKGRARALLRRAQKLLHSGSCAW